MQGLLAKLNQKNPTLSSRGASRSGSIASSVDEQNEDEHQSSDESQSQQTFKWVLSRYIVDWIVNFRIITVELPWLQKKVAWSKFRYLLRGLKRAKQRYKFRTHRTEFFHAKRSCYSHKALLLILQSSFINESYLSNMKSVWLLACCSSIQNFNHFCNNFEGA